VLYGFPVGTILVEEDSYRPGYRRYPLRVRVRLPDGGEAFCVLRVDPLRGGIERETKLLPALAHLGLAVPTVLAGPAIHPDYPDAGPMVVLSELPGRPLPWLNATLAEIDLTCRLHQRAIARLHQLTARVRSTDAASDLPEKTMLSELEGIIARGGPWMKTERFLEAVQQLHPILASIETPLVFSNGDYNPMNFLFDGEELTGWIDFTGACFEDPHIGFAKFIIWAFDGYGWGSKGGLVERYLYAQDVSRSEFAPRLALRCLWRLQRDSSVAGERDAVQRVAILRVLRSSLMSLPDVRLWEIPMRYGLSDVPSDDHLAFPAQSSVLDEISMLRRVVADYDIPTPSTCRFLSRGDSDVYTVTADDGRYYLKVYRPPHTRSLAEAEAQCVMALAHRGVAVVRPVARQDGTFAHVVRASEGTRPILLFEEAPPPLPPCIDASLAEALGGAVAALHLAADDIAEEFALSHQRLETVGELLPYSRTYLRERDYLYLEGLMARVRQRLSELSREVSDFGLCHADLVLSNFRRHPEKGITFFDFGNAAYAWRQSELAVVYWSLKRRAGEAHEALWAGFLSGYERQRPPPSQLAAFMPLLQLARQIGWIGGNCASLPLRLGTESVESGYLAAALEDVRRLEAVIPDLA